MNTEIGVTVQLLEMAAGVRKQFDFKLIMEQAIAQSVTGKINNLLHNQSLPLIHFADELANIPIDLAFGYTPNPVLLAANYLGDIAGDSADVLASHMTRHQQTASDDVTSSHQNEKSDDFQNQYTNTHTNSNTNNQNQTKMGDVREPTQSNELALQTESQWITDLTQTNNTLLSDPTADFYTSFQDTVSHHLDDMHTANYSASLSFNRNEMENYHAEKLQRSADRVARNSDRTANISHWEKDFSQELYNHQHSWWAKGVMGFAGLMSSNGMHLAVHATDAFTRDLMGGVAGSYGTQYFDDLQNGTATFLEAVKFVEADISFQALGEVGANVLGYGARVAADTLPSVGRNVASLFGSREVNALSPMRLRVMQNLEVTRLGNEKSYFGIHALVEEVPHMDVSTSADEATFWSGKGNRMLAETFAENTNGLTLEMTSGGQYLDSLKLFDNYPRAQAIIPWERLSEKFATQASGVVSAFAKEASPSSVFNRIEYPILLQNPNVSDITFDPTAFQYNLRRY